MINNKPEKIHPNISFFGVCFSQSIIVRRRGSEDIFFLSHSHCSMVNEEFLCNQADRSKEDFTSELKMIFLYKLLFYARESLR
jgi:hypothetical protein